LGRQDAGRWTPGDPFRSDKFGNRIAIFVGHLPPPSPPKAPDYRRLFPFALEADRKCGDLAFCVNN